VESTYSGQAKTSPQLFGSDYMWTRDTTELYYMGGSVGIGTNAPTDKLDVDGGIRLSTSGTIQGRSYPYTTNIGSGANATTTNITAGSSDKSEISLIGGDVGDRIEFKTNSSEKMRIDSSGNVGIGTTSVSDTLTVVGPSSAGQISVTAGPTTYSTYKFKIVAQAADNGLVMSMGGTPILNAYGYNDANELGLGILGHEDMLYLKSGNVGIGTTSPSSPLSVQSNSSGGAARFIGRSSDSISGLEFFNNAQNSSVYLQGNGSWFRSRADGGFHFAKGVTPTTSNTNGFTINGLFVGIGTTDPTQRLEVNGNVAVANNILVGGNYTNNSYNSVSSTRLLFGGGNDPNSYFIGTNLENYGGNYTKLDLRWHTGIRMGARQGYGGIRFFDSEYLGAVLFSIGKGDTNTRVESGNFLVSSGNVGIGTTNPAARLNVKETGAANTAIFENSGQAYAYAAIKVNEAVNNKAVLSFAVGDALASTHIQAEIQGLVTNNGGALTGDLVFKTNQGDNVQERMRILANGKVGIGTASPKGKLHVLDGTAASYTPDSEGDTVVIESSTAGGISLIGTGSGSAQKQKLVFGTTGSPSGAVVIYDPNNSLMSVGTTATSNFLRFTSGNGTEVMRLAANGDVGIGTVTFPTTAIGERELLVQGAIVTKPAGIDDYYSYLKSNWADDGAFELGIQGADTNHKLITTSNYYFGTQLNFHTSDQKRMVIDTSGNVGIGTTSPVSNSNRNTLALQGAWGGQLDIMVGSAVHASFGTDNFSTGERCRIQSGTGMVFKVGADTTIENAMRILTDGDIGIGVATPTEKLTVGGKINTITAMGVAGQWTSSQLRLKSTNTVNTTGWQGISFPTSTVVNYGWSIGANRSASGRGSLRVYEHNNNATGTERFCIKQDGYVGIGTTNPSSKLQVVGTITATTKNFLIDDPKTEGQLQYSVIESNEHGVCVRGESDQEEIELPEEWEWLVHEDSVTVQLTSIDQVQHLFVLERNNIRVRVGGLATNGQYSYVVYGTRKDVDPLEVNI